MGECKAISMGISVRRNYGFFILYSAMYDDFFATYRHGLNFWYALTEGHPLSFYSYAKAIPGATANRVINYGAAYDFTIYAFLFSGILLMAAYYVGQYDIIGVVFAVYGVYYYLKGDYKKFYLFFAGAITCKYFALLLFICLVLLYEKRILYIIRNMVLGCWLVVAEKLLFSLGKSYIEIHPGADVAVMPGNKVVGTGLLATRTGYLFSLQYQMGVDTLSVFVLAMGLLCAYCYLQKREENYAFYYKTIYAAFAANVFFAIFTSNPPYWVVLVVPWMVLTIYCNGEHIKLNVIAETIGTCSFLIWHMGREFYMFMSHKMEGMLLYYLLGKPYFYINGVGNVMQTLMEGRLSTVFSLCRYAFYTCMIILVVINFPRTAKTKYVKQQEIGMRGLLIFREASVIGSCFCRLLFM